MRLHSTRLDSITLDSTRCDKPRLASRGEIEFRELNKPTPTLALALTPALTPALAPKLALTLTLAPTLALTLTLTPRGEIEFRELNKLLRKRANPKRSSPRSHIPPPTHLMPPGPSRAGYALSAVSK